MDEINTFINIVNKYSNDMILEKDDVQVRTTSVLGIACLGIGSEIELKIYEDDRVEELKEEIESFIAA